MNSSIFIFSPSNAYNESVSEAQMREFVDSLMGRVVEPGRFANWIAPPVIGIDRQPIDGEYVRFN